MDTDSASEETSLASLPKTHMVSRNQGSSATFEFAKIVPERGEVC